MPRRWSSCSEPTRGSRSSALPRTARRASSARSASAPTSFSWTCRCRCWTGSRRPGRSAAASAARGSSSSPPLRPTSAAPQRAPPVQRPSSPRTQRSATCSRPWPARRIPSRPRARRTSTPPSPEPMIRLLIADDAVEARELVRALLAGRSEIEIVGEATDGREAVDLARKLEPDVILMDVGMPVLDGVAATRKVRELLRATRIVVFAGSEDAAVVMAMMEAGASAYCVKGVSAWELERAIVGAGDPLVRLAHALARSLGETVKAELVARELAGLTGAELAEVHVFFPTAGPVAAGSAGSQAGGAGGAAVHAAPRSFEEREPARAEHLLALPLLADGDALGALVVAGLASGELDEPLLGSVADLAAASLANERTLSLSRAEARRDVLTGLPNRRAFEERLEAAIASASAFGLALP